MSWLDDYGTVDGIDHRVIPAAVLVIGIVAFAASVFSYKSACASMKQEAVSQGVAEWTVDADGERGFRWLVNRGGEKVMGESKYAQCPCRAVGQLYEEDDDVRCWYCGRSAPVGLWNETAIGAGWFGKALDILADAANGEEWESEYRRMLDNVKPWMRPEGE